MRIGRPAIRLGMKVMPIQKTKDVCHQRADAAKTPGTNDLSRNFTKETFDQVEPGRGGRCEMEVKAL